MNPITYANFIRFTARANNVSLAKAFDVLTRNRLFPDGFLADVRKALGFASDSWTK